MNKQVVKPSGLSALYKPFGLWPHGLYRVDNPLGFTTVYSFKKPQIFVVYIYCIYHIPPNCSTPPSFWDLKTYYVSNLYTQEFSVSSFKDNNLILI